MLRRVPINPTELRKPAKKNSKNLRQYYVSIDLRFNDSGTHRVALYLLDWDNYNGRSERVGILDGNNTLFG